jgi:hypothetical protein
MIGCAHSMMAALPLPWGGVTATQAMLLAAAVTGLAVVLLSTLQRRRRLSRSRTTFRNEPQGRWRPEAGSRREIEQIMSELDQLARQIHGQIDARLARLESMLHEADERIGQLSRLSRNGTDGRSFDVTLDEPATEAEPVTQTPAPINSAREAIYRLADGGLPAPAIAQRVGRTTGEVELILSLRRVREVSISQDE